MPSELVYDLQLAVEAEGAWLFALQSTQCDEVAALIMEADRLKSADPRFRAELASWIHA